MTQDSQTRGDYRPETAEASAPDAREVLKEIEWATSECPLCRGERALTRCGPDNDPFPYQHAPDCRLAAALAAPPVDVQAIIAERDRMREALRRVVAATSFPDHKKDDTEYLRASASIAEAFARTAL